ncbi:hypothetical protein BHE90_013509 [Fusarium euwallaceae]|uniref:Aminoglycoside phosphotransferase domain-containing protein n=1 Tax=Fusarium euwallaceae TaxID=1147111 RepID=A0A430L8L6_9HYPO|nr:hypothetical protein BHE90_013509 [Fusarium euwallaceae]
MFASWIRDRFPESCLPEKIVLRSRKKAGMKSLTRRRQPTRNCVPSKASQFPGSMASSRNNDTRAMILSDIGGACLASPEGVVLDEKDFYQPLYKVTTSLIDPGVSHDDSNLDNLHLVTEDGKDKIIIVDMERVDIGLSENDFAFAA